MLKAALYIVAFMGCLVNTVATGALWMTGAPASGITWALALVGSFLPAVYALQMASESARDARKRASA